MSDETEHDESGAPRPGTKADLEQQLAAVREENERLQSQLLEARSAHGAVSPARVTFGGRPTFRSGTQLSEGERQQLEVDGVINDAHTGGLLYADDYDVEVKTEDGRQRLAKAREKLGADERAGIRGVDYVYPSVAPGVLAADAPVRGAVVDTQPEA
jgi:hypothetical protein